MRPWLQTLLQIPSVTMKPFSPVIQTLYQKLVQQLHSNGARTGSVYVRAVKGIDYAYLKEPVGVTRRDVFSDAMTIPKSRNS